MSRDETLAVLAEKQRCREIDLEAWCAACAAGPEGCFARRLMEWQRNQRLKGGGR